MNHPVDHLVDLIELSDVELNRQRIVASLPKFVSALLEVCGIAAANHDDRAQLAKTLGDRETDSRAAAGHDRNTILEREIGRHAQFSLAARVDAVHDSSSLLPSPRASQAKHALGGGAGARLHRLLDRVQPASRDFGCW